MGCVPTQEPSGRRGHPTLWCVSAEEKERDGYLERIREGVLLELLVVKDLLFAALNAHFVAGVHERLCGRRSHFFFFMASIAPRI